MKCMKYKLTFGVLLGAVLLVGLIGCSKDDDCPNCPNDGDNSVPQAKVYVITNDLGAPNVVAFDVATDTPTDSLTIQSTGFGHAQLTSDGKYLLFEDYRPQTYILDAATLDEIKVINEWRIERTTLVRDGSMLFAAGIDWFALFTVPGGRKVAEHEISGSGSLLNSAGYDDYTDQVYGTLGVTDVVFIELDSLSIVKSYQITDNTGQSYYISRLLLDLKTGIGYALVSWTSDYFVTFNAETGRITQRFPIHTTHGDLKMSPDGSEVFVSDPGALNQDPSTIPAPIYIFEAATGNYKDEISMSDFVEDAPEGTLNAWRLAFSPDGSVLYVATGDFAAGGGTVVKFDPKNRKLLGMLFPDLDRLPSSVVVGPPIE